MWFKVCWRDLTFSLFLLGETVEISLKINSSISINLRMGVFEETARIDEKGQFENLLKNVWADHADMISIQYSGTGALKTDFTR